MSLLLLSHTLLHLLAPGVAALGLQGGAELGYAYTDPAAFGGIWAEESALEAERSPIACECLGEDAEGATWGAFQAELWNNLEDDPGFSGPWVHALCGAAYGTLFRHARVDPETQQVSVRDSSSCAAGLTSIAAVCAQSAALRAQGPADWQWHEAVVREEGSSVGDHWGKVALGQCMRLCENSEGCSSLAHGPNGCHLKARCSEAGDELSSPGPRDDGYRTYFRSPCPAAHETFRQAKDADEDYEALLGEVVLLLDMALQLAEKAVHCLARSSWPFSAAELIANRIRFAEVLLGAGGVSGPKLALREFRWVRLAIGGASIVGGLANDGRAEAVLRALERSRLRWARRLNSEVGFWHILLDGREKDEPLERSEEDASVAQRWVETGEVRWSWDEPVQLCARLADLRAEVASSYGPPRVLNTGSGPLAPGPLDCGEQGFPQLGSVPVFASDGLARFYLKVFDDLDVRPPRVSLQCPVEELRECFPSNHFDVVHMRNALDHTMDPLLGIRQMLEVVRPGGWLLLRHARNEGSPGAFQVGLHQWSFDATQDSSGDPLHFMVWNPVLRADVTAWLLGTGLAADVRTALWPHPGRSGDEDEYIWVDIQKPRP